ncbi:MAG: alpha-glucan family phosphorylase [Desulfobacteraceae bacterium]|jgi:starch phosphorylase
MKHIQAFQVFPKLPESLSFLGELSRNMWWAWKSDAIELFRRIDPRLWEESGRNPITFATRVPQKRLQKISVDESYLAHLERVKSKYEERVLSSADAQCINDDCHNQICYFSMEFGIHESLPIFAGGLGILAGDHLKSASHLGLPLTAVGLLYRQGYFQQYLDQNGWQQESFPETNIFTLPMARVKNSDQSDLRISLTGPDGNIIADVWKVMIGRVTLLLLDTNLAENPPAMREITSRLYNAEPGIRLAQEMLLGIGGMRALKAMGINPMVCHMNEGHSAFANIERLAQMMETYDLDLDTAMQVVARTSVFTTHTPVAAGHDEFPVDAVRPYLEPLAAKIGLPIDKLLAWGQADGKEPHGPFSMFILGLHLSQYCNGVSRLHGQVARRMWSHVWPQRDDEDTPITHVTNGVHISSFLAPEIESLFERYLGPQWYYASRRPENVERIDEIYDEELWQAHEMIRTRLISKARQLMVYQYGRRNAPSKVMRAAESALNPKILTLGFARRFATYKRADLLLKNPDRLIALLTNEERPVQIIFAGKAHPADNDGKELIKSIIQFARNHNVQNQIVFLEDYSMHIARHLVQGVDVWLNTPRRPLEACGTSGMKAAINGVLNLSVLDGWWCEGYTAQRGWRIGDGREYDDTGYQDAVESQALYNLLEEDVIPAFYDRGTDDMPLQWIAKMKASMKMAMADFCSHRMVREYHDRFYIPALRRREELLADNAKEARQLSKLHADLKKSWKDIRVDLPRRDQEGPFQVGDTFRVTVHVSLATILPEMVDVQLYYGPLQSLGHLAQGRAQNMEIAEDRGGGNFLYACTVTCEDSGRYGFTARVGPRADDWIRYTPGLLTWA